MPQYDTPITMSPTDPPTLMTIPLEVRHQIFKHVAKRDTKPEKLLRYWFEKKEVKEKIVDLLAKNPDAGTPRVVWEGDRFEDEEREESEEDGEGDSDEEENEDDDEDSEEGDEAGEEGEDEDEGDDTEEQDEEMADNDDVVVPAAAVSTGLATAQASDAADTASLQAITNSQQDLAAVSNHTAISTNAGQSVPAVAPGIGAALAQAMAQVDAQSSTTAISHNTSDALQPQIQNSAEDRDVDAGMADGDEEADGGAEDSAAQQEDSQMDDEEDEENSDNEDADGDSYEDMEDENKDQDTAAAPAQPPLAPVVSSHRKWRHIPKVRVAMTIVEAALKATSWNIDKLEREYFANIVCHFQFMRITHCPPPVELFLASEQLNTEAKNWFYDVAVLHVDATGSFAHTSFFEEALSQITEAAFSPMEDIRKVEVTFVWDSTWLRSDRADCAAAIFPALLRQRAIFVTGILAQAPHLSEVVIHWHDSAEDEEAVDLMNDVLMGFLGLNATVKVETHYIAADAKPYRNSIAGKQRVEFRRIVNNGLDRLF